MYKILKKWHLILKNCITAIFISLHACHLFMFLIIASNLKSLKWQYNETMCDTVSIWLGWTHPGATIYPLFSLYRLRSLVQCSYQRCEVWSSSLWCKVGSSPHMTWRYLYVKHANTTKINTKRMSYFYNWNYENE